MGSICTSNDKGFENRQQQGPSLTMENMGSKEKHVHRRNMEIRVLCPNPSIQKAQPINNVHVVLSETQDKVCLKQNKPHVRENTLKDFNIDGISDQTECKHDVENIQKIIDINDSFINNLSNNCFKLPITFEGE